MMSQAMNLGKLVDRALEAFHKGDDPIAWLCQHFGAAEGPFPPDAFGKALGMIQAYVADEHHDPRDITQEKFSITIPGIDVPFIGYPDVRRGLVVRELKTTGSRTWWTPERARDSLQTALYSMAVSEQNHGAQTTVEHHILNHNGGQYTHTVYVDSLNKLEIEERKESIRETWKAINTGELNAICKPGRCRYPTECRRFGYVGTDSQELVVTGR
jgi:hypothetical protein